MRRLVQPGWILFQIAVVGLFVWLAATSDSKEPPPYGFVIGAGIFAAYAMTIILLILNEGRKDILRRFNRRSPISVDGREAGEDRLARPRSPEALEAPKPGAHRRLGR